MFGPVYSIYTHDPALRDACYRAYNDWLAEFCSAAPDRLIGVAMLPPVQDGAIKELYRLADKGGYRQVNLQIATVTPRIDDPAWEPFWSTIEETGLILSFHVTVFFEGIPERAVGKPASVFMATKAFIGQFLDPFSGSLRLGHSRAASKNQTGDGGEWAWLAALGGGGTRLPALAAVGGQGLLARAGSFGPRDEAFRGF